jgi:hypothetical protein
VSISQSNYFLQRVVSLGYANQTDMITQKDATAARIVDVGCDSSSFGEMNFGMMTKASCDNEYHHFTFNVSSKRRAAFKN